MTDPIIPPQPPDFRLRPVTPVLSRRGDYLPVVGGMINIMLPGENVRAMVEEVRTRDIIIVRLVSVVNSSGKAPHQYRREDIVACQRQWNGLSETWEPISRSRIEQREAADRLATAAAAETAGPKMDYDAIPPEPAAPVEKPKRVRRKKGAA